MFIINAFLIFRIWLVEPTDIIKYGWVDPELESFLESNRKYCQEIDIIVMEAICSLMRLEKPFTRKMSPILRIRGLMMGMWLS